MNEALDQIQAWVSLVGPYPYLQALILIIVFILLGKIVDKIVSGGVARLAKRTRTEFDDRFIEVLHRPIVVTFVLIGLTLATHRLALGETPTAWTVSILNTIGILVWLGFLIRFSRMLLNLLARHHSRFGFVEARTLPLLDNTAKLIFIAVGAYAVLKAWDADITGWLASAGIVGLAVSFAARDTLANIFAGVTIVADAPYKVGDFVILDSGERGQVTQIGIRSTRLLTRDDVEITVPNGIMGNTKIINETGGPHEKYRVRIKIGVAYGSDIDKVQSLLMEIAGQHPEICQSPEPRVRFRTFGESSLDFELLCWVVEPVLRGRLIHELNCEVYKIFLAENIEIPFPQRQVHVINSVQAT